MPILSRWYPPGVQMALLPFGERALRQFMYLERPEGMTLADAEGFAAVADIPPLAHLDRPVAAVPEQWRTVGHLYRGIEAGLARLCGRAGGHRELRVETADRGHRPGLGEPGDRADRGAG